MMSDTTTNTNDVPATDSAAAKHGENNLPSAQLLRGWWLDALIVLLLFLAAVPVRQAHTRGDLWADEADYALASTRGFALNRMDRSDVATDPQRLVRSRHFHPPMTVYLLDMAQNMGREDGYLRLPFVLAGSLVVSVTYLCGLLLYAGRRDISLFCALVVLVTPLQIRAASHAIPWSLISLGLLCVLYTLLGYVRDGKSGWLVGTCGALGWLFCTSESVFPVALATALSLSFVLRSDDVRTADGRRKLAWTVTIGLLLAGVTIAVLWPAGVMGSALANIQHYAHIPETSASAQVGGVTRSPIPKWAFAYWYMRDYRPYALLYAAGVLTLLVQMTRRRLSRGAGVLLVFAFVEIGVAHLAIEFGPQYLAHCLPLLTLMTGFFMLELYEVGQRFAPRIVGERARWSGAFMGALMALTVAYLTRWYAHDQLLGTDKTAIVPRWHTAARFLAARWQPGDRLMVGPQPLVVPRWYLRYDVGLPISDAQILDLPQGRARQAGLDRLAKGAIRFVVVNSTFTSDPVIDAQVRQTLAGWPVIYRSPEPDGSPPCLVIYERPVRR